MVSILVPDFFLQRANFAMQFSFSSDLTIRISRNKFNFYSKGSFSGHRLITAVLTR